MTITSPNNDKVKSWIKLKQKKYRDEEKLFLIEDEHLVMEALKVGIVKEIITTNNLKYIDETYYVNDKIMNKLSNQISKTNIMAVCHTLEEREIKGNILILDYLQDPGNLGTIIRSAVAFNFDTIVLSDNSVDLYNDKVLRASEGMFFHINILRRNLEEFIDNLRNDYTIVTTDVKNGKNIKDIKYQKIALVIGNEGRGVSKEIARRSHEKVKINMNSKCESLNAGVSASILMYEVSNE